MARFDAEDFTCTIRKGESRTDEPMSDQEERAVRERLKRKESPERKAVDSVRI